MQGSVSVVPLSVSGMWMCFINLLCQRLVIPPDLPLHRDALPMNPSAKIQECVCVFFSPLSRPNPYSSPRGCVRRESVNSGVNSHCAGLPAGGHGQKNERETTPLSTPSGCVGFPGGRGAGRVTEVVMNMESRIQTVSPKSDS